MATPLHCPVCESGRVQRDYAPPRAYALILLGLGLIFAKQFLAPQVFAQAPGEVWKLAALGVLALLYGMLEVFRHEARFCADCGYRFRAPRPREGGMPAGSMKFMEGRAQRPASPGGSPVASAAGAEQLRDHGHLNPHTPIEPILACLRFKDETQRRTAAETLRKLTGQDFGEDADAWNAWWAENKEAYKEALKQKSRG